MTALCAPELPAEVACISDSADDQDFWEELGKPSSQGETGSTSRRVMVRRSRASPILAFCSAQQGDSLMACGSRVVMKDLISP